MRVKKPPIKRLSPLSSTMADKPAQRASALKGLENIRVPPPKISPISDGLSQMVKNVTDAIAKIGAGLAVAFGHLKKAELIEEAGWLPHYTSPFNEIDIEADTVAIGDLLKRHYSENWLAVRKKFIARLAAYDFDYEAKETLLEALNLHEAGHYRAVVHLVFPEIERVARKDFYSGKLKGFASLKEVQEAVMESYYLPTFESHQYALSLYNRILSHLYQHVDTDDDIERCKNDPVPNYKPTLRAPDFHTSTKRTRLPTFSRSGGGYVQRGAPPSRR